MKKRIVAVAFALLLLGTFARDTRAQVAFQACHITTQTTTVCRTGRGRLQAVVINTIAATATATIFDNTAASGTVIAVVTTAALATLLYNVQVANGVTVVTATANPDITVITD